MSKAKRKEITVKLGTESFYDILDQKTPEQVIEEMQGFIQFYAGRKISFNVAPYGYDGGIELELYEHRLENDREFEKRIAEEKKVKDKAKEDKKTKEAKEFAEYQRLQKKFQDKSAFN
jgi:F0F1-type ATP synthase alpha subunit